MVHVSRYFVQVLVKREISKQTVAVLLLVTLWSTYLLNDESFNGSCCLMLAATFGELLVLAKLMGVGLIADWQKLDRKKTFGKLAGLKLLSETNLALASVRCGAR